MKQRVVLTQGKERWMATFLDDPVIKECFGKNTLPTIFNAMVPVDIVLKTMSKLHPNIKFLEHIFATQSGN